VGCGPIQLARIQHSTARHKSNVLVARIRLKICRRGYIIATLLIHRSVRLLLYDLALSAKIQLLFLKVSNVICIPVVIMGAQRAGGGV
jgi:hypothetical protein